jgi:hypothetical protein
MKKALVAGALGVTGRALMNHLASLSEWEVIGLSRRSPEFQTTARFHRDQSLESFRSRKPAERHRRRNAYLLRGPSTRSQFLRRGRSQLGNAHQHGGNRRAASENIAESDSGRRRQILWRAPGPVQDGGKRNRPAPYAAKFLLRSGGLPKTTRSAGKAWSWAALRSSCICGFAVGNPMNMATVIAVYATLCKELGLPLRFPGSPAAYRGVMEMTDAKLLAKAILWAAENDRCDGQAFNISNGDFNRWENMWPRLAELFKWTARRPSGCRSRNSCRTKSRSGRRLSISTTCSTAPSARRLHGRLEKRFSISNTTSCPTQPSHGSSVSMNG